MENKKYKKPELIFIGHDAEKLYSLENDRNESIKKCAEEWLNVQNLSKYDFWKVAIPQALFDVLESFDTRAAYLAAKSFIEYAETKKAETIQDIK